MIPCSDRRCTHTDANGVRCITLLSSYDPGPDCFIHQDSFGRPAFYEVEGPSARELLGRLMAAQPTPAGERRAA
jgi:hypothetical protein